MQEIKTERLSLEGLTPIHAEVLFQGLQDEDLYEFIDDSPPANISDWTKRCERLALHKSPDGEEIWLNWAIRFLADDRIIGYVQATIARPHAADIAYLLFHDARGRGLAREAVVAAISYLHDRHAIREVFANVDPRNLRSINLLERLGFNRVSIKSGVARIRGSVADESRYSFTMRE
jgi:[ribosomal protein S5]-alanine N-acetyltransferase